MKKFYLIILAFLIVGFANAQDRDYNYVAPKYKVAKTVQNPNVVQSKGVKAMLLDESFELGVPPTSWTLESPDGGTGWNQQADGVTPIPGWTGGTITVPAGGGSNIAYCTWNTGGASSNDQWLISPQIAVSTGDNVTFQTINFYEQYSDVLEVKISTTDAAIASFTIDLGTITWDGSGSGAGAWTEYSYDLSAYDGQSVYIAFREVVADNYNDGGSIGLDLVQVGSPAALDLGIVDIDLPPIFATGLVDITGTVRNFGSNNVISFDVIYTIDGTDVSATYSVTGVDIAYGETYVFTHDVQYDFATAATYNVSVEISNVNLGIDENLDNNVLAIDVAAAEGVVPRRVLHEVLTSSTCAPCASANPVIDGVVFDPANIDNTTTIKYQVSWPAPGDPYQTPMAADRVTYYGVTGVPAFFVDANVDDGASYSQGELDAYMAIPSFFEIEGEHTVVGPDVEVEVTITPNADFTGVCHVVVIESQTTENVGNNGETEFYNVAMAMLPTTSGTAVDLTAGTPYTFTVSKDMSDTFVEETFDLEVVMFLQVPGTKEVMQSNYSVVNNVGSDLILTDIEVVSAIVDCAYSDVSEISATLFNYGVDDITEFDIQYVVDGGAVVSETVTYTILAGEEYVYTFPTPVDLSALGFHEIAVECSFAADVYTENNALSETILSGDDVITVDITFDTYPGETSWEVIDMATDDVVAEGSGYTGGTISVDVCILSDGCYDFVLYDSYGDGMDGTCSVSRGGAVVGTTGTFTNSETIAVNIPLDVTLENITICPGETITFPAVGIGVYDVEAATIDNSTPATTTVTYTIADGGVCEVSESFDVVVLDDALDITPVDITICQNETITFMTGEGVFAPTSVDNSVAATTTVTYTVNGGTACENSTTFDVIVNEAPVAVITLGAGFELTIVATDDIVWYLDDVVIDDETSQSYVCTADGDYYAIVSNANCSTQSNTITVTGTFAEIAQIAGLNIYPNPVNEKLYIEFDGFSLVNVKIMDATGKLIISKEVNAGEFVDVSELSTGIYFVDVKNSNNEGGMYKIVVE